MGFELEYTLNGRRVSQRQFFDGMQQEVHDAAVRAATERIESVRCRQHGQRARATLKNQRGDRLEFSITGCCDQLIEAAQRAV